MEFVTFLYSHLEAGVSWRVTGPILLGAGHHQELSGNVGVTCPSRTCLGKGAAGVEPVRSSQPGLGGENVPKASKVSRLSAREEEAKPWVRLEKSPPPRLDDDEVAAVMQIV